MGGLEGRQALRQGDRGAPGRCLPWPPPCGQQAEVLLRAAGLPAKDSCFPTELRVAILAPHRSSSLSPRSQRPTSSCQPSQSSTGC